MPLPTAFLDELKARVEVSSVVGRQVKLTRAGKEYSGLCPFHKEKTPSFTVNNEKRFYHCFGCGANGDIIKFIMETEGRDFRDAVQQLAHEAGLDVPQDSPEEITRTTRRSQLIGALERAAHFWRRTLKEAPQARKARDYLQERGVTAEAAEHFRLGFAPVDGTCKALHKEGFDEETLEKAGLLRRDRNGRARDMFWNRLMFPVTDRAGKIIGFGGRVLNDSVKAPKYINSPATEIFHKGHELFGLHAAYGPARREGLIICVEGYMDVIALSEHGFPAVAPLGTALSAEQLQNLWRLTAQPVLCFDGDDAGRRAAWRAAERALPLLCSEQTLSFAEIAGGADPDQLIKIGGADAMHAVLNNALSFSDFLWRGVSADEANLSTPEARGRVQKRIDDIVRCIDDQMTRKHFAQYFKNRLWEESRSAPGRAKAPDPQPPTAVTAYNAAWRRSAILLAVPINHPALAEETAELLGSISFEEPVLDELRQTLTDLLTEGGSLSTEDITASLQTRGHGPILNRILSNQLYTHAFFARPDTGLDDARQGWREVWDIQTALMLDEHINKTQTALAENYTDEGYQRLRYLQQERQARHNSEKK